MRWPWQKKPVPWYRPGDITVHFASDQVSFMHRSRQRCGWCGQLIEHKDWDQIPVPGVEGKTYDDVVQEMQQGTWGGLVGIDATGMPFHVQLDATGMPPRNCCLWEGISDAEVDREIARLAAEAQAREATGTAADPVQPVDGDADTSIPLLDRPRSWG